MHPLPLVMAVTLAAAGSSAAFFKQGMLPGQPPHLVGGGEVLLEVAIEASGGVSEIRTLRATAPYTDLLRGAVKGWMFEPARNGEGIGVPSRVLVGGHGSSQVLIEFIIGADGTFTTDVVGEASSPFKEAALDAARQWRFRPVGSPSFAYIVFGLRPPP